MLKGSPNNEKDNTDDVQAALEGMEVLVHLFVHEVGPLAHEQGPTFWETARITGGIE
jgi:hypothetical protein